VQRFYSEDEELEITLKLRELLTLRSTQVVGQNFHYDAQYFAHHYGYVPNLVFDTMITHHTLLPGTPKSLDFLSSIYCDFHRFWKNETQEATLKRDDNIRWLYNCTDCCVTFEIAEKQASLVSREKAHDIVARQHSRWWPILRMMLRGIRIDLEYRKTLSGELSEALKSRMEWLAYVLGHELNPKSPKQMATFFYTDLMLPVQRQRKGKRAITCDDEALKKLAKLEPIIAPIVDVILEIRSIGVFKSTFVDASLDTDDRMRCSFNVAGPETMRLSSGENAFGSGTNIQNIPTGEAR
jgi:DNA polymerase I-like protein with 3'-5' exonuclease and polymerase domains